MSYGNMCLMLFKFDIPTSVTPRLYQRSLSWFCNGFCPGSESPEFAHSTRLNFIDDLEYRNINNVSHFRRDSRVRVAVKVR